jgi:hypothetical protein
LTSTLTFWTAHFCVHTCPQATLVLWKKNQQETEFICVAKRTRYVLVWITFVNICVTNDHGFVVIIILSFIHDFSEFVTRGPRWVSLVEQELLTLKKRMSSPLVFVRFMLLNLVSCVAFCGSLFVLLRLVIVLSVFRLTASE